MFILEQSKVNLHIAIISYHIVQLRCKTPSFFKSFQNRIAKSQLETCVITKI